MSHRILERGAIACSAVVVAQWVPAFAVQLPASICQKKTQPEPVRSSADPAPETRSPKCFLDGMISLVESLPEQFKLQWSQRRASQLPHSMEREYHQLIEQAQTLASQNRIPEAIALVAAIPKNTRYSDLAYQLQEGWSQEMLDEATHHYRQADLSRALNLLKAIPATSTQYSRVTQLKQKWQQDAAQLHRAIAASKAGAWQEVIRRLETFKNTPLFQSLPVQQLWQTAMTEMLEPDSTLLQIASKMDSTSLSTASLPPSAARRLSPPSLPSPLPPSSSRPSRARPFLVNSAVPPKSAKPDRVAVAPRPAPAKQDRPSEKKQRFDASPSSTSTAEKNTATIADR